MPTPDVQPYWRTSAAEWRRALEVRELPLEQRLAERPEDFELFQALRRLDALWAARGFPPLGTGRSRKEDPVHLGQAPFLHFAPRAIDEWREVPERIGRFAGRPVLTQFALGFFGPNGALPRFLTQHALERQRERDFTFTNFVNVFQHRLLCFWYRAWASVRPVIELDRPGRRRFCIMLGSLAGLGGAPTPGQNAEFALDSATASSRAPSNGAIGQKPAVPFDPLKTADWAKLRFVGRLIQRTRSAEGLQAVISGYFGVPTVVLPFVGRWLELEEAARTRLGGIATEASRLGSGAVAGSRVWECQTSFRVRMGPLSFDQLRRMFPRDPSDPADQGALGGRRLISWIREYAGLEYAWDVQIVLRRDEVPPLVLGRGARLGWTTFLVSRAPDRDPDGIFLNPEDHN